MAVIRFTAVNRGELPSWLGAGAQFYLANDFQAFPRRLVAKGEREETLDGTPEGWLDALQREYSIKTDFIPLAERDLWRAFFTSVLNAETFAIDFSARQLLGNPGFETGVQTPWLQGSGATTAINTTAAIVGTYGAQFTIVISAGGVFVESATTPTLAGFSHLFQMLARRSETSIPNRSLRLFARFLDVADATLAAASLDTAEFPTTGVQPLAGTFTSPANTVKARLGIEKTSPHNTDEAGVWHADHTLMARLSAWTNVWLIDDSIDEQQIGGVGVQYSFRVKEVT